ncbi:MAG: hypothetical protein P4L46_02105 [Fimbriimonas sp.]|nr:hypothetical protein [Fimbriimonas sp.]
MIKELLLVHHSHTDIGYTHPQPAVFELHDRFIDMALDMADASAHDREDGRFRWTCEVTGTTRRWWERASAGDRDRFLSAIGREQLEVAALEWHLTPLANLRMLVKSLENVQFFRSLGIPVRSAMNTDVNGVPWGLVDSLLDHGIDGFSMSTNSHFGAPVLPRPGAFRWVSPDGRELLVWNGFQYWHFASVLLRMPTSVDEVAAAMPGILGLTEERGYSLPYLPVQITNPHHPDNASPDSTLGAFVREWNDRNPAVRIRTILLSDLFDRLRNEDLPILSGDWTDYWNFGAGSSSRETVAFLQGLRTLDAAHELALWPTHHEPRMGEHLGASHAELSLYAEHTWGADCSVSSPESLETATQWSMKAAYPYRGLSHARIVMRDGLDGLARRAGGDATHLLVFNSSSVPSKVQMRLPVEGLDWLTNPGVHHRLRMDGALASLPAGAFAWCSVDVPALGYRTYPVSEAPRLSSKGLIATADRIESPLVSLEFLASGGVRSLTVGGIEYCGALGDFTFGLPILERPSGGTRREIMNLDFGLLEPAEGWIENWEREILRGQMTKSQAREVPGAVEFEQTFSMANGDRVSVLYRLFADDPSVDLEIGLDSAGDERPYSLALPFTLPSAGDSRWHYDTAGAIVEFDREQLPNAARHFVTAGRFVRMQTDQAELAVSTPDLPLWKFGGMFFAPSTQLDAADRKSVMLAWLANNYWEVNFLANQRGRTNYRLRLLPGAPEPVDRSYLRAMPYAIRPIVHPYRGMGLAARSFESLVAIEGEGVWVESLTRDGDETQLVIWNLGDSRNEIRLVPGVLKWDRAWTTGLDGTPLSEISPTRDGAWVCEMPGRALIGLRLARETVD